MEFRMLEWYRVGASWWDIAHETIDLITHLYQNLNDQAQIWWIPTTKLISPDLSRETGIFIG